MKDEGKTRKGKSKGNERKVKWKNKSKHEGKERTMDGKETDWVTKEKVRGER